jgi:hypothetical protein
VGDDVVDVPGERQPVLVPGGLFAGLVLAAPFRHPLGAQPHALPQQHKNGQPRGAGKRPDQGELVAGGCRARHQDGCACAGHGPGLPALPGRRGEHDRQRQGQEHRTPRVGERQIRRDGRRRGGKHHQRGAAPQRQGDRTGQQQDEREGIQRPVVRLPGGGEDGAHHLEDGHGNHDGCCGRSPETALHTSEPSREARAVVGLTA